MTDEGYSCEAMNSGSREKANSSAPDRQEGFLAVFHAWDWQSPQLAIVGSYLLHVGRTCEGAPAIGKKLGMTGDSVGKVIRKLVASGEVVRKGRLVMVAHRQRRRGLLCHVPYWALHRLTPLQALLYGRIWAVHKSLKHRCQTEDAPFVHSQKTLAEDLGVCVETIQSNLRVLQSMGLVHKRRVKRPLRGLGRLFIYAAITVGSFVARTEALADDLAARFHRRTYVTRTAHTPGPPSARYSKGHPTPRASAGRSSERAYRGPPGVLERMEVCLEGLASLDREEALVAFCRFLDGEVPKKPAPTGRSRRVQPPDRAETFEEYVARTIGLDVRNLRGSGDDRKPGDTDGSDHRAA